MSLFGVLLSLDPALPALPGLVVLGQSLSAVGIAGIGAVAVAGAGAAATSGR